MSTVPSSVQGNQQSPCGIVSSVSVVVHGLDTPYGVLGVHAESQRGFSDDDVHFLQSVANLITLVMRRGAMNRVPGAVKSCPMATAMTLP